MNDTMQAISQDELGGPEVLKPGQVPIPRPGMGEILIRVHAASVNPADVMNRQSGVFVGDPPFVLGWDVSGTVATVGPGVTLHRPGDEVFGMLPFPHGHGAHAQYAVGPARALPKPDRLDHVQAAALPLAGLTAWQAWWTPPTSTRTAAYLSTVRPAASDTSQCRSPRRVALMSSRWPRRRTPTSCAPWVPTR